jgi:hypothetical protein
LDAAPLAWVGYVSEGGFGVRARWWLFDQRSATSAVGDFTNTTIISASPAGFSITTSPNLGRALIEPSEMFLSSNLKLNVWDFEATRETVVGRWILLASAGFRYAHLSQDYNAFQPSLTFHAFSFFVEPASHQFDLLSSGHNFNGAGPTIALEARRPMGNSGFSLFANLRGTMLFGQSKQQVVHSTVTQFGGPNIFGPLGGPIGPPPRIDVFVSTVGSVRDVVLPVTELEMGAEFSRTWGAVRPFVRTGLVAQTWFDAGSATKLDGSLGFLGLSVTAGLNY